MTVKAEMWGGPIDGVILELNAIVQEVRVKALGVIRVYELSGLWRRQAMVYRFKKEVGDGCR